MNYAAVLLHFVSLGKVHEVIESNSQSCIQAALGRCAPRGDPDCLHLADEHTCTCTCIYGHGFSMLY